MTPPGLRRKKTAATEYTVVTNLKINLQIYYSLYVYPRPCTFISAKYRGTTEVNTLAIYNVVTASTWQDAIHTANVICCSSLFGNLVSRC